MAGRFAVLGGFTVGPPLQHRIEAAVSFSRREDEFKKDNIIRPIDPLADASLGNLARLRTVRQVDSRAYALAHIDVCTEHLLTHRS
jgi:hypothetical protein